MESIIKEIKLQTNIEDDNIIEETYKNSKGDVVQTIMKLMNITQSLPKCQTKSTPTIFDNIREILAEKELVYHEIMSQNNKVFKKDTAKNT